MKKRFLILLSAVLMALGLSITASAASFGEVIDDIIYDSVSGSSPISESEAMYAYSEYYGIPTDELSSMLVFVSVPEYNIVEVWENAPADEAALIDVVTYGEDGNLHSYQGWSVEPSSFMVTFESVAVGAPSFLTLVGSVFDFCVENEICQMFLTVTFFGIGIRMMRSVSRAFVRR